MALIIPIIFIIYASRCGCALHLFQKIPPDNYYISAKSSNFTPKYTFLLLLCL